MKWYEIVLCVWSTGVVINAVMFMDTRMDFNRTTNFAALSGPLAWLFLKPLNRKYGHGNRLW